MADDTISDAGHGPSRGYSGMNKHLLKIFRTNPKYKEEQASRSKSLGQPAPEYRRRLRKRKRAARKFKGQL